VNLRRLLTDRRLRPLTALGHGVVVTAELALERTVDRLGRRPPTDHVLLPELTVLVKTFERPPILRRFVDSVRRFYPDLAIIVVDDSREPKPLESVETITMPYDSGLSAGRNEGLRRVSTKYVLVLDDDFVFFRHTRLGPALEAMEQHPEIDIMGGQVVNLPFYQRLPRSLGGPLYPSPELSHVPLGRSIGGFAVAAKVPNFFVARRERLALVPWDPRLKLVEHADFFTRALGVLTTVFNPHLRCLHARTPFDATYMRKRMDFAASVEVLQQRYGA
jgi:glycosyltransferase involved in cell wall biosynthesis